MIHVCIFVLLVLLVEGGMTIMAALDDLTTAVTNLEAESATVIAEIATLKAGGDALALAALTTRINTVTANLTAAVAP